MSGMSDAALPASNKSPMVTIHDTPFPTISVKLDGTNYRVWAQIMEMYIAGKKKKGYLTGRKVVPKEDDPSFEEWDSEDKTVKSWLINSMNQTLMAHFVQYGTAKEVWDAIRRSYLDVSDSSQVYELMKKSFQSRQGGRPLADYYNELNSIFLELDYRRPNDMGCPADIEKLRKRTGEERVYVFLAGLDHNLDQVSARVLAASPMPSLEEAYAQVRREAQRQVTMGLEDNLEASAMAVHKNNTRPTLFCTHCNSSKHTVDVCWKKHGYPEWFKLKQAEKRNKKTAQVTHNDTTLSTTASASQVSRISSQAGNLGSAFVSAVSNAWIIDSGATDHMTNNSSSLATLMPSNVKSVQVANGAPMPIYGAGNVSFSPAFSLSPVLL